MADLLAELARRAADRAATLDRGELEARARDLPVPATLEVGPFGVLAEFKRRSPSRGELGSGLAAAVDAYAAGGAVGISVLTEPSRFGGSLDDLEAAARRTAVPVLRKDFLVDPRQVLEARIAGASGVLLMASILDDDQLLELLELARSLGLFVLAESHDAWELERVQRLRGGDPEVLVGVNTRDFATLTIEPSRLRTLAPHLDPEAVCVAESGIAGVDDARIAARLGYRLVLVGTALVQARDRAERVAALVAAGRLAWLS